MKNKKTALRLFHHSVPKARFELAHPCERCALNTVCLPVSPLRLEVCKDTPLFSFPTNSTL